MAKVWSSGLTGILFIGDVVARAGRRVVKDLLPGLREEYAVDFVIANGENAAGGRGLTNRTAQELFEAGVDVITSGNHIWEQREAYELDPQLRPTVERAGMTLIDARAPSGLDGAACRCAAKFGEVLVNAAAGLAKF